MSRPGAYRIAIAAAMLAVAVCPAGVPAAPAARRAAPAARAGRDTVLVRVGRDAITSRMVQQRIDELPEPVRANYATPDGRQRLIERVTEEKVWMEQALRKGVADRPDIRRQLEQQRRDLIIRTYVTELMGANAAPSDSDARVYYDAHAADFRVPASVALSHIQLKTEAEARRVAAWARSKQDWKLLVQKYSVDTLTRKNAGALGVVTREGVFGTLGAQPAIAESGFALGAGKIGGPVRTDRGWHVLRVESVKEESLRPFDQVKGQILRQLSSKRAQDFYSSKLDEVKRALGVSVDSAAVRGFVSQKKSAREMFNEAQNAGDTTARIEAYRKVLAEYPDSEVSPQAQFMIGFIQ